MKHIEFSTLLAKFEGSLPETEVRLIESHTADCGECRETSNKLQSLFAYIPAKAIDYVPQATTARILNIYKRTPDAVHTEKTRWFGLEALVFDDWQTALNERYAGVDSRQMLFSLGTYDLDMRIDLTGDKCTLTGQIFPEVDSAIVEVLSQDLRASVPVNELGEFTFEPLPQGVYDIRITTGDGIDLHIEQVPLKH